MQIFEVHGVAEEAEAIGNASASRVQEDLPRHLARALLARTFFGAPTGPAPQIQRDLSYLL
jgi:hypothetical protein